MERGERGGKAAEENGGGADLETFKSPSLQVSTKVAHSGHFIHIAARRSSPGEDCTVIRKPVTWPGKK